MIVLRTFHKKHFTSCKRTFVHQSLIFDSSCGGTSALLYIILTSHMAKLKPLVGSEELQKLYFNLKNAANTFAIITFLNFLHLSSKRSRVLRHSLSNWRLILKILNPNISEKDVVLTHDKKTPLLTTQTVLLHSFWIAVYSFIFAIK